MRFFYKKCLIFLCRFFKKEDIATLKRLGVLLVLYYLYFSVLNKFLYQNIFKYFVDKHSIPLYSEVLLLIVFFIFILARFKILFKDKKTVLLSSNLIYSLFISLLYIPLRFDWLNVEYWEFASLELSPSFVKIYYIDFVFLVTLFLGIESKKKRTRRLNPRRGKFNQDNIWSFGGKDQLNRSDFAREIAVKIDSTITSTSFAIGIKGSWGSGKSVLMNLIERNLNEDNIIIHFNPWRTINHEKLIEDFFSTLIGGLSKYNATLSSTLENYYRTIIGTKPSQIEEFLSILIARPKHNKSLKEQHEMLETSIIRLKRRIVVFIDDLDRLEQKEIFEVLRIIRNTVDFPNTFFVVGYDEAYIQKTMNTSSSDVFDIRYLQKIFQLEVVLPSYPYEVIRSYLIKFLKELTGKHLVEIEQIFGNITNINMPEYNKKESKDILQHYIVNLRDAVRFSNFFSINYRNKLIEGDPTDYFLLELIRYKYERLYETLKADHMNLSEARLLTWSASIEKIILKKEVLEASVKSILNDKSENDIEQAIFTVKYLYYGKRGQSDIKRSIRSANTAFIYFSNKPYNQISIVELNEIIESNSIEMIKEKINSWKINFSEEDLKEALLSINTFPNKDFFAAYLGVLKTIFSQDALWQEDILKTINLYLTHNKVPWSEVVNLLEKFEIDVIELAVKLLTYSKDSEHEQLKTWALDFINNKIDNNSYEEQILKLYDTIEISFQDNANEGLKLKLQGLFEAAIFLDSGKYAIKHSFQNVYLSPSTLKMQLSKFDLTIPLIRLSNLLDLMGIKFGEVSDFNENILYVESDRRTKWKLDDSLYSAKKFKHPWQDEPTYLNNQKELISKSASFLMTTREFTLKEAFEGGTYVFQLRINIAEKFRINNSQIILCVDDELDIFVNRVQMNNDKILGGPERRNIIKLNFSSGDNLLELRVNNYSGPKIGFETIDKMTDPLKNNPYGIAFVINFEID